MIIEMIFMYINNKKPLTINIRGFIFGIDKKSLIINSLQINRYLHLQNQRQLHLHP
jgi:hypothetical protein